MFSWQKNMGFVPLMLKKKSETLLNHVLGLSGFGFAGLSLKGGVLERERMIEVTLLKPFKASLMVIWCHCCVFLDQVVKNLIYVAKVIFLISPESDTVNPTEEQEEVEGAEEETTDKTEGNEEEDKEQKNKPASLLWVMKKLSLLAKREAADTPKVPLKVSVKSAFVFRLDVDMTNVLWFEDVQLS